MVVRAADITWYNTEGVVARAKIQSPGAVWRR